MKFAVVMILLAAVSGNALAEPTAEELYSRGKAAYDRGDWSTAIAQWQRSYDLSGAAVLLFNLAQAQRRFGDCTHALSNYKHFLELDPLEPKSEQHVISVDFIKDLEPTCGAPSPTPYVDRPITEPGRSLRIAGLVAGGTGAALLVTGFIVGTHASAIGDDVTSKCAHGCDWPALESENAQGRRYEKIGYVFDAVGFAVILGGAAAYYFGNREQAISISPRPREGGAVVTWSCAW
jgi:tetratricopeptide (TPR) repeat protein